MTSWFDDPKQLIRTDKVLNFWPSSTQSSEERVNSAARFYNLRDLYNIFNKKRRAYICYRRYCTRCTLHNGKI